MEEWKDIVGYEGLYQVSTLGRVKSFHKGNTPRLLKPHRCSNEYLMVQLSKDGLVTHMLIHRLVAQAFIDNPCNYPQVNHKDEDVTNNRVDNLEWCTAKYNSNYGTHNQRLSESKKGWHPSEEVIEGMRQRMIERHKNTPHPMRKKVLCVETGQIFESIKSAQEFVHLTGVYNVVQGKRKTAGGYHWRYVNGS